MWNKSKYSALFHMFVNNAKICVIIINILFDFNWLQTEPDIFMSSFLKVKSPLTLCKLTLETNTSINFICKL